MKKLFWAIPVLLFFFTANFIVTSCGVNKYEAGDFKQRAQGHQVIAILPPAITYNSTVRVNNPYEQINQERFYMQNELYTRLLKLKTGNKPVYIQFQDINATNEILRKNSINNEELKSTSTTKLAQLLGVDAVLFISVNKNLKVDNSVIDIYQTGKQIGDILKKTPKNTEGLNEVSLGKINIVSSIFNGTDGYLLWRDQDEYDVTADFKFDQMVSKYVYLCGYNFPYRR